MAPKSKTGVAENWIVEASGSALISEAKKQLKMAKNEEIGKNYNFRVCPVLSSTFFTKVLERKLTALSVKYHRNR